MMSRLRNFLWPNTQTEPLLSDKRESKKITEFLEWETNLLSPLLEYKENGRPFHLANITLHMNMAQCLQTLWDFGSEGCLCINGKMPTKDSPYFSMCKILLKFHNTFIYETNWPDFIEFSLKSDSWLSCFIIFLYVGHERVKEQTAYLSIIDELSQFEDICFLCSITEKEWPFRYLITFVKLLLIYKAHVSVFKDTQYHRINKKTLTNNRTWK
jgi:hypothetical protein